jgi:transcriptional regulator with XRE-family HTH domain
MSNAAWITRQSEDKDARREYERERLSVWVFDSIAEAMDLHEKTKADVARELGTSRAHVTQLFSGERNPTLRTLADLAFACESRIVVNVEPLREREFIASPACIVRTVRPDYVQFEDVGPAQATVESNSDALAA